MCGNNNNNNLGIIHQAKFTIDILFIDWLLLSVCVQAKNGLESKFQILFLDPLPLTSSQSHHIPYCPFYSFLHVESFIKVLLWMNNWNEVPKIFCIDHIQWNIGVSRLKTTPQFDCYNWNEGQVLFNWDMFCECEWQAFFVCQYTHPHLLTKRFAQQILRLKVHSFTLGFKDTRVESP